MDSEAIRDLEILEAVAEGRPVTQRALAARLGIALGLANLCLKRLVRKGYVKVTTIPSSGIKYLVTPRGFAEKSRLTYEYLRYSLRLYRDARAILRAGLASLAQDGRKRIAIYGTGEAAELAFLTLKELGIEPVAILDGTPGSRFLGHPVRALGTEDFDHLIVATLDPPEPVVRHLVQRGVPRETLVCLRAPEDEGGG